MTPPLLVIFSPIEQDDQTSYNVDKSREHEKGVYSYLSAP